MTTRREWRRMLEQAATRRPMSVICVTLQEWEAAVRNLLPHCSPELQRQVPRLMATMQRGPCARCQTTVIWGAATPREPLKYCEPCGAVLAAEELARTGRIAWVDSPTSFTEEAP